MRRPNRIIPLDSLTHHLDIQPLITSTNIQKLGKPNLRPILELRLSGNEDDIPAAQSHGQV
jgi:hypothetical protein